MAYRSDAISIEVLEDGTIKVTTDPVSSPNHANAEAFLRLMADMAGGDTTRVRRGDAHAHTHWHDHTHDHAHDKEEANS